MKKVILCCLILLFSSCALIRQLKGKEESQPVEPRNRYYYYLAGRWALMEGDVDSAIRFFEDFLRFEPFNTRAILELAGIYFERKRDIEKTYSLIKRALSIEPENTELLLSAAEIASARGKNDEALTYLEKVLSIDEKNEKALLYTGTIYLYRGELSKAKHYLNELVIVNPSSYLGYYYLAKVAVQEGKIEEAKRYYEKASEINPDFKTALFELAQLYSMTDIDKAIELYSELLETFPFLGKGDIKEIKNRLADLYISKGKYEEAVKQLEDVEKIFPGLDVKWKLGLLYFEMGDWESALREFEFVLTVSPDNKKALLYHAYCLNQLGDDERAIEEFSSFQPDDPLYELARFQMAGIYFERGTEEGKEKGYQILEELRKRGKAMKDVYLVLGSGYREDYRLEEAKEVLKEGFTYYPDDVEMGLLYGAVLEELGDVNGAIEVVKKLLETQPENPDVLNFLGYTYLEYDMDIKEAERMIKKAYEKSQEGYITDSVGFLYYKKGELNKALHYIHMALEKSPDDGEIWEHLGDIYLKMGNLKKAREAYSTALTKKLREKQRKRIEEKLKALESSHNK